MGWRRGSILVAACLAVALAGEARATVPCNASEGPCHNDFAEPAYLFGFGADAMAAGIVTIVGNAVALHRNPRPALGWIVTGYLASAYNLVQGIVWTAKGGTGLSRFPDDETARMQLGWGLAELGIGTITLALASAAHARRVAASRPGVALLVPSIVPTPGGVRIALGGQF